MPQANLPRPTHLLFQEHPFYINYMDPQQEMEAHDHNFIEMTFIMGGTAEYCSIRERTPCHRGDVFVVQPGAWHAYAHCKNLKLYNCLFSVQLLENQLAWTRNDLQLSKLLWESRWNIHSQILHISLSQQDSIKCRTILGELLDVYRNISNQSYGEWIGLLLVLLSRLGTHLPSVNGDAAPLKIHSSGIAQRAAQLLSGDLSREWTLDNLAETLNINPSYFVRIFKNQMGMAPMKYLAHKRAECAANLLLSTQEPITSIAAQVGWEEPKIFARCFKHHFGMSASSYRKREKFAFR